MGLKWGHLWVILDHFWVDPGSFRYHLASFWGFGVTLTSFWGLYWAFLDPFSALFGRPFSPFLGRFYVSFAVLFWEVDCNIKQNNPREGKMCKFLPKFT